MNITPREHVAAMAEAVTDSIKAMLAGANFTVASAEFYSDVLGFYHAVDWTERWLIALVAFHIQLWVIAVALRHSDNVQMVLLVLIRTRRSGMPRVPPRHVLLTLVRRTQLASCTVLSGSTALPVKIGPPLLARITSTRTESSSRSCSLHHCSYYPSSSC